MLDESEQFARTQALTKTSVTTRDGRFRAFSFGSKERIGSAQGVGRHRLALKEPTRSRRGPQSPSGIEDFLKHMSLLAKAGLPDVEKMKGPADKYEIEFLPPQRRRSNFDRSTMSKENL